MMHIFSMKDITKHLPVVEYEDAPVLYIPLNQNVGRGALPIVKEGERILKYQLIAEADGIFSSDLHSPVSGIVKEIGNYTDSLGRTVEYIAIENDFKEECLSLELPPKPEDLTDEDVLSLIQKAGVAGEGGAQFPTHLKYRLDDEIKIATFIINGTECEPYLTADYSLMKNETEKILKSALVVNRVIKAERIIISVEKKNKDLIDIFLPFFNKNEYRNFEIKILPDSYPQGSEIQLIKSVTGKEIPKGSFPRNHGIIVSNVGTLYAVYNAVFNGFPVIDRIVTISGDRCDDYGNFRVKIGTPVQFILQKQGMDIASYDGRIVLGGPFMGEAAINDKIAISKGSGGVLLLKNKPANRQNCISCGYCSDVCPVRLLPYLYPRDYKRGKIEKMKDNNLIQCIECAACEYICPSNVALISSIKEGKEILKNIPA